MAHKHTQSKDNPDFVAAVAKGYESQDLKLRGIFVFIGVLSLTLVVVLIAIYAIMMALVEHDRSNDVVGSPVTVTMAPVYAPLQPSPEHDWLDQDDMMLMRQKTQEALRSSGTSSSGRRYISIESAIDLVADQKMLPVKAVVRPIVQQPNPPGSWEGYTPNRPEPATNPAMNTEASAVVR